MTGCGWTSRKKRFAWATWTTGNAEVVVVEVVFSVVSFCFQLKKAIYHFVASLISIRMPQMIRGCRKLDFSASNISNFDHGACGHVACVLFPSFAKYKTCSYLLMCKLYLY